MEGIHVSLIQQYCCKIGRAIQQNSLPRLNCFGADIRYSAKFLGSSQQVQVEHHQQTHYGSKYSTINNTQFSSILPLPRKNVPLCNLSALKKGKGKNRNNQITSCCNIRGQVFNTKESPQLTEWNKLYRSVRLPHSTHTYGRTCITWYKLVFVQLFNAHGFLSGRRWPRQPLCNFLSQEHGHVRRMFTTDAYW